MIGMTMCSGIGAPEMAAPWVDWRFASEIEPFPREVLQQRFGYALPEDQNQGDPLLWSDMTEISPDLLRSRGIPLPDLIVAGTPCQAFSIAGLRKGTEDARGNLTLKFVEICHAIVAARPDGRLAVLWENVPGVLSDKGNAFGCFLGGLVGAVDALQPPTDGSWPSEGMVQGPRARAAWCVLDAQWFGVAQRRRRVFVVIDFGNCIDPAAILLEPDRLRGDSSPRREEGERATGFTPGSFGAWREGAGSLRANGGDVGGGSETLIASHDPAATLETTCHDWSRADGFNMVACATGPTTHALTAEGHDASEDGTGRGTPIVAFDCKGTEVQTDETGVTPPLRSMGHHNSHQNAGGHAAVAFDLRGREGGAQFEGPHDTANIRAASGGSSRSYVTAFDTTQITSPQNVSNPKPGDPCHPLAAGAHPPAIVTPAVRRLTPTECERLQGFPDEHTAITYRNKPAADGPRYKALGNSMAVPVIAWILTRLHASWEQKT